MVYTNPQHTLFHIGYDRKLCGKVVLFIFWAHIFKIFVIIPKNQACQIQPGSHININPQFVIQKSGNINRRRRRTQINSGAGKRTKWHGILMISEFGIGNLGIGIFHPKPAGIVWYYFLAD